MTLLFPDWKLSQIKPKGTGGVHRSLTNLSPALLGRTAVSEGWGSEAPDSLEEVSSGLPCSLDTLPMPIGAIHWVLLNNSQHVF